MRLINKVFNWYFGRRALPYWLVVIFDLLTCFVGGLLMVWMRHPLTEMLQHWPELLHTFLMFAVFNLIGFRAFHTYSGILRYSQFVDLMRVVCANGVSLAMALGLNFLICHNHWHGTFYALTGRMTLVVYLGTMTLMCLSRVIVKLLFDQALMGKTAQNTFVYGTQAGAVALTNYAYSIKPTQFIIKGYMGDEDSYNNQRLMGKKIYSIHDNLATVLKHRGITAVLVSPLKHDDFLKNKKLQDLLIENGVKIYVSQNAKELVKDGKVQGEVHLREVRIEDLLSRDEIQINLKSIKQNLKDKRVLITGSAGSIGSEIVRQVASFEPAELVLIDAAETPQHDIRLMMRNKFPNIKAETIVTNICKEKRMEEIFKSFKPDFVFHAAAYKHVPMMEDNPSESVQNNVWGTKIIADLSVKYGVKKFVMVSTDKAVNPTNVMGCSKRICEIYVQSLNKAIQEGKVKGVTQFVTTRFGNVLGSNGSVIPLFRKQLAAGGPLTVTHPKIIRFFMLIPEACKLVLEAGIHGKGGEIYVFDMGDPVRIADLAKRMIQLSGAKNVEIKYTGLREGEKLYEEVLNENENTLPSFHPKIRIALVRNYEYEDAERELEELHNISLLYDDMETVKKMKKIVPEYISKHSRYEALDPKKEEV